MVKKLVEGRRLSLLAVLVTSAAVGGCASTSGPYIVGVDPELDASKARAAEWQKSIHDSEVIPLPREEEIKTHFLV